MDQVPGFKLGVDMIHVRKGYTLLNSIDHVSDCGSQGVTCNDVLQVYIFVHLRLSDSI